MDDVLEMAEMLLRTRNTDALALVQTVEALAAEVRELRKDKARLDWVLANCTFRRRIDPLLPDWAEGDRHWIDKQIDAATGGKSKMPRVYKYEAAFREWKRRAEQAEARVAELEAKLSEYENDRLYLAERCAECGHRFAFSSNVCAQCNAEVGPDEPETYPDHCPCQRCFEARKALRTGASGEEA